MYILNPWVLILWVWLLDSKPPCQPQKYHYCSFNIIKPFKLFLGEHRILGTFEEASQPIIVKLSFVDKVIKRYMHDFQGAMWSI